MLYRAVDYLPRSFGVAAINAATAMVLPLQAAFFVPPSSSFVILLRVKEMLVADVFQYNARLNFVHWEDTRDPSLLNWKRTPDAVFKTLASGKLQFQPYFVPVCSPSPLIESTVSFAPLVQQLCLQDGQSLIITKASAKVFHLLFPPLALRNISATSWKFFWSLSRQGGSSLSSSGQRPLSKLFKRFFGPWIFPMSGTASAKESNHTESSSSHFHSYGLRICATSTTTSQLIPQRYWPASATMFVRPLKKISAIPSCSSLIFL